MKSIKIFKAMLCIVSAIILLSSCTLEEMPDENIFVEYTQEQRKAHVTDHLLGAYGVRTTVERDINRRQVNPFSSEKYYYAIATTDENKKIYCWIDEKGNIRDTYFVFDMNDEIIALFEPGLSEGFSECKITCTTTFDDIPSKTWNSTEALEMLEHDDVFASVKVFINKDESDIAEKKIAEKFNDKYDFTKGMIYFYYMEKVDDESVAKQDLTDYDKSFVLQKSRETGTSVTE